MRRRLTGPVTRVLGAAMVAALAAGCDEAAPVAEAGPVRTLASAGASNPTVALTPEGDALVAWVAVEDGTPAVLLQRMGSEAAVRVNQRDGDAAPHEQAPADVRAGPSGHVYVVWQNNTPVAERRFPASDLRFARSTDGGRTFEPAIYVNDDAGGPPASHTFHDMAVTADGTVYVSWIDGRARAGEGDGGGEGATGPDIRIARSVDGGESFGPSTVVAEDACPCCRTALSVGPDGAIYVAWRHVFDGNIRDIVVARSTDGGASFEAPVRVHHDGWALDGCPHAGPGLAVDGRGRIHVAWFTGAEGRAGLHYAMSTDGGRSFGDPYALTPPGASPVAQVKVAADAEGGWVAWEHPGAAGPEIRLARVTGDEPRLVEWTSPPGRLPELAVSDGELLVAWLERGAVRASRLRVGQSGSRISGSSGSGR